MDPPPLQIQTFWGPCLNYLSFWSRFVSWIVPSLASWLLGFLASRLLGFWFCWLWAFGLLGLLGFVGFVVFFPVAPPASPAFRFEDGWWLLGSQVLGVGFLADWSLSLEHLLTCNHALNCCFLQPPPPRFFIGPLFGFGMTLGKPEASKELQCIQSPPKSLFGPYIEANQPEAATDCQNQRQNHRQFQDRTSRKTQNKKRNIPTNPVPRFLGIFRGRLEAVLHRRVAHASEKGSPDRMPSLPAQAPQQLVPTPFLTAAFSVGRETPLPK